ncbi:MAG: hypothetical protein U5K84_03580 [Alkalibacterium sp.]|nr:hypothetical protein [Alkalibacterium sp.]
MIKYTNYEELRIGRTSRYDAAFADAIPNIDGSIITEYDQTIPELSMIWR